MATPREIFERDCSRYLCVRDVLRITNTDRGEIIDVYAAVLFAFEAGVRYASIFIEDNPMAIEAISYFLEHPDRILQLASGIEIQSGLHDGGDQVFSSSLGFSGRIIACTAFSISEVDKCALFEKAKANGLNLVIRDGRYFSRRMELDVPQAFISHDSRDKDSFVRGLANSLQRMLFTVWYDEFSLVPGQSLRASIEQGLKTCKKCILILSPQFIENEGWTKAEFDSIFTREILEMKNVIIPVWHNVTKEQVYEYSPRLLDRVAINSSIGVDAVAIKIFQSVTGQTL